MLDETSPEWIAKFSEMHTAACDKSSIKYPGNLQILKYPDLNSEQRYVEMRFATQLECACSEYIDLYQGRWQNELNTDNARELSDDYSRSVHTRTKFGKAVHEPSGSLIKKIWDDLVNEPQPGNSVIFLAGGGGSGKTFALEGIPELNEARQMAKIIYDTTMSSLPWAEIKISQALKAELDIGIYYVYCPIELATKGVIERAIQTGRVVPALALAIAHYDAPKTFLTLAERYATKPSIEFRLIVNDWESGGPEIFDSLIDFTAILNHHSLESIDDALRKIIEAVSHEYDTRGETAGKDICESILKNDL